MIASPFGKGFATPVAGSNGLAHSIHLVLLFRLPARWFRDIDPYEVYSLRERPHVSRAAALAVTAATQAFADAKVDTSALEVDARRRIAVVLGSGGGGLEFTERQYEYWYRNEPKKASVYTIPTSTIGGLCSEISMAFGLHGGSHLVSTGCTSSTDAIFYACENIVTGRADMVVTGGTDAPLAPGILAGFGLMRILTESWNAEPEHGSRPFSADRDEALCSEKARGFTSLKGKSRQGNAARRSMPKSWVMARPAMRITGCGWTNREWSRPARWNWRWRMRE